MNLNQAILYREFLFGSGIPEPAFTSDRDVRGGKRKALQSPEIEEFAATWAQAELQGDTAFLENALADDFVGVGPRGFQLSKAAWVGRFSSGALTHSVYDWDEASVRLYGECAIVLGRLLMKGTHEEREIEGLFRVSLCVVRQSEVLKLAGLQLSPLSCEG